MTHLPALLTTLHKWFLSGSFGGSFCRQSQRWFPVPSPTGTGTTATGSSSDSRTKEPPAHNPVNRHTEEHPVTATPTDPPTLHELIENATGRNAHTLQQTLADFGLTITQTHVIDDHGTRTPLAGAGGNVQAGGSARVAELEAENERLRERGDTLLGIGEDEREYAPAERVAMRRRYAANEHIVLTARAEAAEARLAAVRDLARQVDVLYPPKFKFGAEENYCAGYHAARADLRHVLDAPTVGRDETREFYGGSACKSGSDGDCDWVLCPQLRDGEPKRSGRHCPRDETGDGR